MFKIRLIRRRAQARKRLEAKRSKSSTKKAGALENGPASISDLEESKEEEAFEDQDDMQKSDRDLGLEQGEKVFCYAYYKSEYKSLRAEIIREVFRDLTGKWNRHFVVYPLSPCDDIQLMFSRFYFLLYEIESPLKFRCTRFSRKYTGV